MKKSFIRFVTVLTSVILMGVLSACGKSATITPEGNLAPTVEINSEVNTITVTHHESVTESTTGNYATDDVVVTFENPESGTTLFEAGGGQFTIVLKSISDSKITVVAEGMSVDKLNLNDTKPVRVTINAGEERTFISRSMDGGYKAVVKYYGTATPAEEEEQQKEEGEPIESDFEEESAFTEEELEDMSYVNDAIEELRKESDYVNGDTGKRQELAMSLLWELEREGYVSDVHYDGRNLVSFVYSCGVDGGILLVDFSESELNGERSTDGED